MNRVIADEPLDSVVRGLLAGQVEILPWEAAFSTEGQAAKGVYTYGHPRVDREFLDRLPGISIISNYGVGVDHIDLAYSAARGIPVGNTPGILDGATADMAFTLLLAGARRLVEGDRYARSASFVRYDPSLLWGQEVHGTTLGIVGFGRIGKQVARRARAFEMRLLYHNRRRDLPGEAEWGAEYAALDDLLARADHVVLCVPLSDETRGLIGRARLELLKPTATLVNVSRGPVVDTAALTEALQAGRFHAAALDVTDPEPLPRGHPLLSLDNVIIAPHLGSATHQTRRKMAEMSVENLLRGLRGEPLVHRAN